MGYAVGGIAVVAVGAAAYMYGVQTAPPSPTATLTATQTATQSATKAAPNSIRVGYVLELTGAGADLGNDYLSGLNTWAVTKNDAGGILVADLGKKLPVEVVGFDDKSDASIAAQYAARLVASGVHAVGPCTIADINLAMAPVFVDAKIPWFMVSLPAALASQFGAAVGKTAYFGRTRHSAGGEFLQVPFFTNEFSQTFDYCVEPL